MIALLAVACAVFGRFEFPRVEVFFRDALQYVNDDEKVDKSLVTFNLDNTSEKLSRPLKLKFLQTVIDRLQSTKPKYIFLMIEPLDLTNDDTERRDIYNYFKSHKNLYLNAFESRNEISSFIRDPLFKDFPNFFKFIITSDQLTGAQDNKNRRAMIYLNNRGPAEIVASLNSLGINTKKLSFFDHNWKYWETTQVYIKNFRLGTFGNFQSSDLLANKIENSMFTDKIVIVGTHDEFSFLAHPSVFDFFGKIEENNVQSSLMPFQEIVAHLINFYTTGDYVKYVGSANDLVIIFFILTLLILVNLTAKTKLIIFLSVIPIILIFEFLIYFFGSYYIDFSRSITLLVFIQYLAIPMLMLLQFKALENSKFKEINDARIDSLLLISERVAHDIRSPLSAINIILSKVKIENAEYTEILKNSLKRIDDTAEKILTKYKSTNLTNGTAQFETINLADIIESLIEEKKTINSKVKYVFLNSYDDNKLVLGHRLELEQVISNILDNSIFALISNSVSPEIQLKTHQQGNTLTLQIVDNGIGVPEAVLNLIGSIRITTKPDGKGNGIALLHAKRIIERMNGNLEIESIESKQTTVKISLKLAKGDTTS